MDASMMKEATAKQVLELIRQTLNTLIETIEVVQANESRTCTKKYARTVALVLCEVHDKIQRPLIDQHPELEKIPLGKAHADEG
jgi:acetolactate synthase small subunit